MRKQVFNWCLVMLLLAGGSLRAAYAQRLIADRVISSSNASNPSQAVDGNSGTAATLTPPLALSRASLLLGLPGTAAAGQPAGAVLNTGGLLSLTALGGTAIRTYLAPSTDVQQELTATDIVGLAVLSGGQTAVTFTATQPFNQIEIVTGGVASLRSVGVVQAFGTAAATPLPVQLVGFGGQAGPGGVQLGWSTASELNSRYFEVQRADDGERFVALGRVAAAGTSSQPRRYAFTDATPLPLAYYRLRQVDADGTASYSAVVLVRAQPLAAVQAYPTRFTSQLTLASPAPTQVEVFDQRGQLLRRVALGAGPQQLDASGLPAGIYFLRDAATGQRLRVVKEQ